MSAIVPQTPQALQELFLEPVSMTLYEFSLLRKLNSGRPVGQRGINHLLAHKLVYKMGDDYYFSPGVRKFLEKRSKETKQARTVKIGTG